MGRLTSRVMLTLALLSISVLAVITLIVLAALTLSEPNATAGLLCLKLNATAFARNAAPMSNEIHRRDVLQDLGDAAKSVADTATTKLPAALSHAESAAAAIATAVPQAVSQVHSAAGAVVTSLDKIEQRLPRNCSIGTRQACIGYLHNVTCFDPPLNLSSLFSGITLELPGVSDMLEQFISDAVTQLQPLADRLRRVSSWFQKLLSVGLVLTIIWFVVSVSLFFSFRQSAGIEGLCAPMTMLLVMGMICCVPLVVLVVLFSLLRAQSLSLPSWVEMTSGSVSNLCSGMLALAAVMVLLTVLTIVLSRKSGGSACTIRDGQVFAASAF